MTNLTIIDVINYHLQSLEMTFRHLDVDILNERTVDYIRQRINAIYQEFDVHPHTTETYEPELTETDQYYGEEETEVETPVKTKRGRPRKSTRTGRGIAKTVEAKKRQQEGRSLGGKRSAETRRKKSPS